ncbi:MAG: STAS domain-containing protein [bacterium]
MEKHLCVCVHKGRSETFYMTVLDWQPGAAMMTSSEELHEGDRFFFLPAASDQQAKTTSAAELLNHKRVVEAMVMRKMTWGHYQLRLIEERDRQAVERVRSRAKTSKVELSLTGPIATVKVTGNIDIGSAARMTSTIKQATKESYMILMDLVGVNTIASSGLGLLIQTLKECQAMGKELKFLVDPQSYLVQAIALAHLDKVLEIYTTREEAVEAFLVG